MSYIKRKGIWRPQQVPTFPVEVDWSHPLSVGLFCLLIPGSIYGLRNLTDLAQGTLFGTGPIGGSAGGPSLAWGTATASSRLCIPDQPAPALWAASALIQVNTVQGQAICAYQNGTTAGSSTYDRSVLINASGTPQAYIYSGAAKVASAPANVSIGLNEIAGVYDGTDLWCYLNGKPGAAVASGAPYSGYTSAYLTAGYNSAESGVTIANPPSQNLVRLAVYHGAPSASLMAWLAAEPFAMLRPKLRRRYYYTPSGGSGTTITLGQAAWGFTGRAPSMQSQFALAQKAVNWNGQGPAVQSQFTLGRASWGWAGRSPTVAYTIALAQKAWGWAANTPALSFFLVLGQKAWGWVGNPPIFSGSTVIALAQATWGWVGKGIVIPVGSGLLSMVRAVCSTIASLVSLGP